MKHDNPLIQLVEQQMQRVQMELKEKLEKFASPAYQKVFAQADSLYQRGFRAIWSYHMHEYEEDDLCRYILYWRGNWVGYAFNIVLKDAGIPSSRWALVMDYLRAATEVRDKAQAENRMGPQRTEESALMYAEIEALAKRWTGSVVEYLEATGWQDMTAMEAVGCHRGQWFGDPKANFFAFPSVRPGLLVVSLPIPHIGTDVLKQWVKHDLPAKLGQNRDRVKFVYYLDSRWEPGKGSEEEEE